MDKLAAGAGSRRDVGPARAGPLMHGTTHCGLGATACNPLRDTLAKFRPAYERRLRSLRLRCRLRPRRRAGAGARATGRDDPRGAHLDEEER
jgi:[NiFe] hydrogenase diaphorase moiety large subunit